LTTGAWKYKVQNICSKSTCVANVVRSNLHWLTHMYIQLKLRRPQSCYRANCLLGSACAFFVTLGSSTTMSA
jgi:hypothetical protein